MKNFFASCMALMICCQFAFRVAGDSRYFELRIYQTNAGRHDDLARLVSHYVRDSFQKHKIENIGCWVPADSNLKALYQIVAYRDKATYDAFLESIRNDPGWKDLTYPSPETGKIVAQSRSIAMNACDISPAISASSMKEAGSFELRIYHCFPGKLNDLLTRFRDHTLRLFEKHGMQNLAYWTTMENNGKQPDLVYLLGYPGKEAGINAWIQFRKDPQWMTVKANSEKNGLIVDSVTSVLLKPLNLSDQR